MTEKYELTQEKVNIGDRTAIIAAGIAIGISLIAAPGLYSLMNIPIGLVLIVTLHAVDNHEDRNRFQSASFALAWALTFLLIAGLFLVNPYIANHGIYITDNGQQNIDHFTFLELPDVQWIKSIFKEEASDFVSFCIVGIVATMWYFLRRRFFAVYQSSSQPKDLMLVSSQSSAQQTSTSVLAEKRQEHATETMSDSISNASGTGPITTKYPSRMPSGGTMIVSIFIAFLALFIYTISSRWLKHI